MELEIMAVHENLDDYILEMEKGSTDYKCYGINMPLTLNMKGMNFDVIRSKFIQVMDAIPDDHPIVINQLEFIIN